MTTKTAVLLLLGSITLPLDAFAGMPPAQLSPTACLAEWNLALNPEGRLLTTSEMTQISMCLAAELLVLRKNAEALSSQIGVAQPDFAPRAYAEGTLAAARELVSRLRQGPPTPAWYSSFWLKHGKAAMFAADILFSGNSAGVRDAAVANGEADASAWCSRFCMYAKLVQAEPSDLSARVDYLLAASSKTADMVGVRLGESAPSVVETAYDRVSGPWPTDEVARRQHEVKLFAVFLALRAIGDARHATLDFGSAGVSVKHRVHYIRTSMNLNSGQKDLRFTRDGFFIQELSLMKRI